MVHCASSHLQTSLSVLAPVCVWGRVRGETPTAFTHSLHPNKPFTLHPSPTVFTHRLHPTLHHSSFTIHPLPTPTPTPTPKPKPFNIHFSSFTLHSLPTPFTKSPIPLHPHPNPLDACRALGRCSDVCVALRCGQRMIGCEECIGASVHRSIGASGGGGGGKERLLML